MSKIGYLNIFLVMIIIGVISVKFIDLSFFLFFFIISCITFISSLLLNKLNKHQNKKYRQYEMLSAATLIFLLIGAAGTESELIKYGQIEPMLLLGTAISGIFLFTFSIFLNIRLKKNHENKNQSEAKVKTEVKNINIKDLQIDKKELSLKVKKLISTDKMKEAIEEMKVYYETHDDNTFNELILLSLKFTNSERNININTITNTEYMQIKMQVGNSIINILNRD